MKKIKVILCIIFGHKLHSVGNGGYCKRCGWGVFAEEYMVIGKISKYRFW